MQYIHQLKDWPVFKWDHGSISQTLGTVRNRQGRLLGRMESLGFSLRSEAVLQTLTLDVVKSSEIEGEILNEKEVRSSIARRLGMDVGGLVPSDRHIDGVVEMVLDAVRNFDSPLSEDRLFGWHTSLFPGGRNGMRKITVGAWRDDSHGPMRVISGTVGHEHVHFEAPEAGRLKDEMQEFIKWFNTRKEIDPVIKAGVAHLWFVTLHPFEDGNGRIARAIADMQLARADGIRERFYSMSVQIRKERKGYYDILEKTQGASHIPKGKQKLGGSRRNYVADGEGIDITKWLIWFLECLNRSLETTENTLSGVFKKAHFWEVHPAGSMNERQRIMINRLLEGFDGKLTSSKWAKMTKCSQDTALRDILDLVEKNILHKDTAGGRSTSYSLHVPFDEH